jgi:hypothetical protein
VDHQRMRIVLMTRSEVTCFAAMETEIARIKETQAAAVANTPITDDTVKARCRGALGRVERAAAIYSLVGTAKRNGLDPEAQR